MQKFSQFPSSLLLLILFVFLGEISFSQSFSDATVTSIPDNGSISVPVSVSGLPSAIDVENFGLESMTLNIAHAAVEELTLQLQAPDGTIILLAQNLPGTNFTNTTFDGTATQYIDFGSAPYNGSFRPIVDLAYLNNGQNPNGTWNLIVRDGKTGNIGAVDNVTINFGSQPAKPILTKSNLPIVKINTNGNVIVDDPKVEADMVIISNENGELNDVNQTNYSYSGKIGIEIRGHSSQMFPKKQYGFETLNEDGSDDMDVSLLGLPKQSDWIFSANYSDKTMMRNILSYQLSREMGNYASRTIYCELIINNEYKGVFVLMEKIKRDKNRVNVEKMAETDITPPNVTGGYIFAIDKSDPDDITWKSKIPPSPPGSAPITFIFVYPKKDIPAEQKTYIENYVDTFEEVLNGPDYQDKVNGFRKYADETSFMDFFVINELARNIDGLRLSSYFHKSREGKIVAGPVWDFDIAWGNANYFDGNNPVGFDYLYKNFPIDDYQMPFWWGRFMSDVAWEQMLNCRYSNFRTTVLSLQNINGIIDSLANVLQDAQVRNFTRWNIIGKYVWPNPTPIPSSFSGEVDNLKNWVVQRLNFLDGELGTCGAPVPVTLLEFNGTRTGNVNLLTWKATNEVSNRYFVIEKSLDSQTFVQVGVVDSKGGNSEVNDYSFEDKDVQSGVSYYRLKQVDYSGDFTYSKIVAIGAENTGWAINPNVVETQLTILSPFNDNRHLQLNIFNMQGQRLRSEATLNNSVINLDIGTLPKGSYLLQILNASGGSTTLRFIKK